MEEMRLRAEQGLNSAEDFRGFVDSIKEMTTGEKQAMLTVVENVEARIISSSREPKERLKSFLWYNLLSFLTMGFDVSTQMAFRQNIGPEANRDVLLARIERIKRALSAS
jgi:hypothetical protein